MENFLYPTPSVRCNIKSTSCCGKSYFPTILNLKYIKEIYIYSSSFLQDLYQKIFKCFSNYIPINIIPSISIKEVIGLVIGEVVSTSNFEKSDTGIETCESID